MRHGKKFPHLGRKTAHRKYMLANMACSLIEHKSINTTLAKAKALKLFIEPIITKSKNDSTHNRRVAFRYLRDKTAVTELFREISVKIGDRPGGYTRVIKLGNRLGDNADMALIELVDYNEIYSSSKPDKKRRRRRKKSSQNLVKSQPANQDSVGNYETVENIDDKNKSELNVNPKEPNAEEAPAVEEAPAASEEAPAVEEAPAAAEEAPAVEETPAKDDKKD